MALNMLYLKDQYLECEQSLSVAKIAASNSTSSCDSKLLLMLQSNETNENKDLQNILIITQCLLTDKQSCQLFTRANLMTTQPNMTDQSRMR